MLYDEFLFVIHWELGAGVEWLFCLCIFLFIFYYYYYFFTFTSSFCLLCASTDACSVVGKGGGSDQGTDAAERRHCNGRYCALLGFFCGLFVFVFFFIPQPSQLSSEVNWVVRHMVRVTRFRRLKHMAEAWSYLKQPCWSERLCFLSLFYMLHV